MKCSKDSLQWTLSKGDYFGEISLLHGQSKEFDVIADSEVECAVVYKDTLLVSLGSKLDEMLYKNTLKIAL